MRSSHLRAWHQRPKQKRKQSRRLHARQRKSDFQRKQRLQNWQKKRKQRGLPNRQSWSVFKPNLRLQKGRLKRKQLADRLNSRNK